MEYVSNTFTLSTSTTSDQIIYVYIDDEPIPARITGVTNGVITVHTDIGWSENPCASIDIDSEDLPDEDF